MPVHAEDKAIAFGSPVKAGLAATALVRESPLVVEIRARGLPVAADRPERVKMAERRAEVPLTGQVIDVAEGRTTPACVPLAPIRELHVILLNDENEVVGHSMESSGTVDYVAVGTCVRGPTRSSNAPNRLGPRES